MNGRSLRLFDLVSFAFREDEKSKGRSMQVTGDQTNGNRILKFCISRCRRLSLFSLRFPSLRLCTCNEATDSHRRRAPIQQLFANLSSRKQLSIFGQREICGSCSFAAFSTHLANRSLMKQRRSRRRERESRMVNKPFGLSESLALSVLAQPSA